MTPVHKQISNLTTLIQKAGTVTKRREHSSGLRELLSEPRNREMLLHEAMAAGRGREALSTFWSMVLKATMLAAEQSASKKAKKYAKQDFDIPKQMVLRLSEFQAMAEMDSLLGGDVVLETLQFCLFHLAVEEAKDVAEVDLLQMLAHMCSQPDFVSHFRPHKEMNEIMTELVERLDEPDRTVAFEEAAKAFAALMKTAKTLGIGMHTMMPRCLDIVDSWCKDRLAAVYDPKASDIPGIEHMYEAATALLSSHPEQAIHDLATYGRSMIKLATMRYSNVTSKQKREALVEYFLSHLLVCQTAGKLQGLLPGDLGDVGEASLDFSQVDRLLEMTVSEADIDKSRMGSEGSKLHTKSSRNAIGFREQSMEPTELSRRHFELCARLLSTAQRQYLSQAEWDEMHHPVQEYLNSIPSEVDPNHCFESPISLNPSKSCSQERFLRSPWMQRVGLPLWSFSDKALSRDVSLSQATSSKDSPETSTRCNLPPRNDIEHFTSMLEGMSDMMYDQHKSPVPFLQLVCACAETFPLGQCWASNSQQTWHSFTPADCLSKDRAYCNGCSTDDVALLVSLVTNILEAVGGPDGDEQTQRWVVTCLLRLTESSGLVAFASEQRGESSPALHLAWRRAWNALLNADLRYASYTRNAKSNTIGELVLILLTELVQQRCTDPPSKCHRKAATTQISMGEFVRTNQNRVWSLDAFSNADSIEVCAVFDLVSAILQNVGLSEDGRDAIDASGPKKLVSQGPKLWERVPTSTRRYRLVSLCLRFLERMVVSLDAANARVLSVSVCSCLAGLISGKSTLCSSSFDKGASLGVKSIDCLRRYFFVTNMHVNGGTRRNFDSLVATFPTFFESLWIDESGSVSRSWFPDYDLPKIGFAGSEMMIAYELHELNWQLRCKRHCDFISPTMASSLHKFVTDVLMKLAPPSSIVSDENYEFDESAMGDKVANISLSSMSRRTYVLKVLMTVAFSDADDTAFKEAHMELVEKSLNSTLDEIIVWFPFAEQVDERSITLAADLLQILRALSIVSLSIDGAAIPSSVQARLVKVFGMCKELIQAHSRARRAPAAAVPPREHSIDFDDDMGDNWGGKDKDAEVQCAQESDASDDGSSAGGRKRRQSTNVWGYSRKRTRHVDSGRVSQPSCPNAMCARHIASIMILLQPSYGVCRMVAEAIALSDNADRHESQQLSCDVDLDAALHCLDLFCTPLVLHHSQEVDAEHVGEHYHPEVNASENGSTVSLCCDIVQDMRSAASTASNLCLFGFEVCIELVHHREVKGYKPLDKDECLKIIKILLSNKKDESRLLKVRPNLRSRRLAAATSVFRYSRDEMHKHLDAHFKRDFIGPGLDDLSESVRKQVTCAVAAALQCFTQQKAIINGIIPNLPPLLPSNDKPQGILDKFEEWYAGRSLMLGSDSPEEEYHQVWKGALYSFQSFSVEARGLMAASTSIVNSSRELLFSMVLLASERPDLEALCYHICEKAAALTGFGTVKELLLSQCEYIIDKWLDTGKKLKELPLLLTAPTLLLQLLRAGMGPFLLGHGAIVLSTSRSNQMSSDDRTEKLMLLRELTAKDYVERSVHFALPIVCIHNATNLAGDSDSGIDVSHGYLEELTEIMARTSNTNGMKALILGHLPDILAFVEPLLHSVDENSQMFGKRIVAHLQGLVTEAEYNTTRRRKASVVVRQLLCQWGQGGYYFDSHDLSKEVVFEAIEALSGGDKSERCKAPFVAIGSSVTEQVLHGRFWLSQSILRWQKMKRWSSVEMVFALVLKYMRSAAGTNPTSTQVGFCIHTIIDILADPSMSVIYPAVLQMLNAFLNEILHLKRCSEASSEVSAVFYRLVGMLVTTHRRFQDMVIEECLSSWVKEQGLVHHSSGLLLSAKSSKHGSDVWGWDTDIAGKKADRLSIFLAKDGAKIDECLHDTLIGTYETLERLLVKASPFRGSSALPLESLSSFVSENGDLYETLAIRNPKLSARSLVASFLEGLDLDVFQSVEMVVSMFLDVSATLMGNCLGGQHLLFQEPEPTIVDIGSVLLQEVETPLLTDFVLLLDELKFIQKVLEGSKESSMVVCSGSHMDVKRETQYSLVDTLLKLCEESYPQAIRQGASRCIGALGPCDVKSLASVELELSGNESSLFQRSKEDGKLQERMKGSCLELLAKYLLSPSPVTAIVALDAAKAIVTSKEGLNWHQFVEKDVYKMLLHPLADTNQKSKPMLDNFVISDQYLDSMMLRAGGHNMKLSSKDDPNWCWHKALWISNQNGTLVFEDWVRFITCAMISCCYTSKEGVAGAADQVRGSTLFFRYCVKLCALEHEFASRAFPAIILDLLQDEIGHLDSPTRAATLDDSSETLACQHLSRCFASLINSKADLEDTVHDEQSRSLSLAVETIDILRFLVQMKFENKKHVSKSRRTSENSPQNGCQDMKHCGIPIGIVLRLNGLNVAHACMQANKFASAIFYLDMHSDRCYGGAGRILERLSSGNVNECKQELDISGFENKCQMNPVEERGEDSMLSLPSILHQSFIALHDRDSADAVNIERAALSFFDESFKWNSSKSLQVDALDRLKALDLQCRDQRGRIVAGQHVMDCMDDIGLEDVLHTYMTGFVANQDASSSGLSLEEQANFRECWFRGKLKSLQWGSGEIFEGSITNEPSNTQFSTAGNLSSGIGFHEGICKALLSFEKDDMVAFQQILSNSRFRLVDDIALGKHGDARLGRLVSNVERLEFLNDVESLSEDKSSCSKLALKWQSQNDRAVGFDVVETPLTAMDKPLRFSESVLWVREIMLRAFQGKATTAGSGEDFRDYLVNHLWQVGSVSRLVGRSDYADSVVQRLHSALHLRQPAGLGENTLVRLRLEEAMIMESRGDFSNAIRGLKHICAHFESMKVQDGRLPQQTNALYADALLACGEWMDRYKVEPGNVILEKYLIKASKLANDVNPVDADPDPDNCHHTFRSFHAHLALAELASRLFESVCKVAEGPEWKKAGRNIESKEKELKICNDMYAAATKKKGASKKRKPSGSAMSGLPKEKTAIMDLGRVVMLKERELRDMQEERKTTEESIPRLLRLAVESYGRALSCAGHSESLNVSSHVYRLLSLWFANCGHADRAETVNDAMSEIIPYIPSFRFVPLTYQISSRLASGPNEFQLILEKLIYRMCIEHPYHCIIQIISLSNGDNIGHGNFSNQYKDNIDIAKVNAAKGILAKLGSDSSSFVSELVDSSRVIVDAYIRLAFFDTEKYQNATKGKNKGAQIPLSAVNESMGSAKSSNRLEHVLSEKHLTRTFDHRPCIFTKPPVLNPGGQYENGLSDPFGSERIKGFDSKFTPSLSGLSRPKFIYCHGELGRYKQVVKGNDDVRGDVVMQQVFCFVNNLMKRRRDSGRGLNIITYNIVPLSPNCGVLEFVKDSVPFGSYVIQAHSKYNPGDMSFRSANDLFKDVQEVGKRREVYDTICRDFSPAFRHFFTERFGHSLPLWYASKMKYTRSCAVNSVVGHMLGIGDRHTYNILINEKTGEVAHIDFGIVFEQGKLLDVPETVPFRLTRDIIDGMGPCGIEGTFSRAAEETTTALLENTNALLTILSAVVSDPLYRWNLTPREARRRQRREGDGEEDRALEVENEEAMQGAEQLDDAIGDGVVNEAAVRALSRIEEKLQGYEDGRSGQRQSVEGQVQFLINSARDEDNLCRLFHGWRPFL